ncbi:MAG: PH domain-containing protein [Promethearchaeota archaeon]
MEENSSEEIIFKPVPSNGGILSWILLILIVMLLISISIPLRNESIGWIFYLFATVMGLMFGLITFGYYNMRYVIVENGLKLRWAFFNRLIPYESIEKIGLPSGKIHSGIRVGGIGIPGYLFGKFKLVLDGNLKNVSLYSTKLDSLVFIFLNSEKKSKCYGLTPAKQHVFVNAVKKRNTMIKKITIDTEKSIQQDVNISSKNQNYAKFVFIISLIIVMISAIYFAITYGKLPETEIPIHWGLDGQVNRWGSKSVLLPYFYFTIIFGIFISFIFYYYVCKKSEIGKTKWGYGILIFPLSINIIFMTISFVIIQITFNSL